MGKQSLLDAIMNPLRTWARVNSPFAIHFNSGSCNGCDIEILATLTPRYDLERFVPRRGHESPPGVGAHQLALGDSLQQRLVQRV